MANISASGVLFRAAGRLEIEEVVEVEIAVNPVFMIRCALRVVRAQPVSEAEWAYGAEFAQLAPSDAAMVLEAIAAITPSAEDAPLSHRPRSRLGL